ncbi:TetR/AcrR family transcriptional regulator [Yinghuangia soli]|uniref:TetR/AcrR family transcriptional regulator n=1 Tax=Yinghuangia soli TaxID=2908204 RepID=A0AA41Q7F2_9ACTN|nr:TetR/AcrR family transcriptional regulator [Yinghuangia soli]MCF2532086.1 TetR/AcrR family transcriptional regulator [Yinghuangia soli]
MSESGPVELSLGAASAPERADAVRSRAKILAAAAELVAEKGPDALTMNAVAHAAGIGVGTVYRRFGDVGQLLSALLDARERQFQADFMSGPPPLGPGAPPAERLRAFLHAVVDRVVAQHDILLAIEIADPCARYARKPYRVMHMHVAMLLAELRPEADAGPVADLLLAPASPSLVQHLHRDCGLPVARIKQAVDDVLGLYGWAGPDEPRTETAG